MGTKCQSSYMMAIHGYLLCFSVCLSVGISKAPLAPVTIAIIMDSRSPVMKSFSYLSHNFTIAWHLTDYTELFQVFKQVQDLDNNSTVDLIFLVDYKPPPKIGWDILQTTKKKIIMIKWKSTRATEANVYVVSTVNLRTGHGWNDVGFSESCRYCRCRNDVDESISETDGALTMADTRTKVPSTILAKLTSFLNWKSVFVFYENTTEEETRLFTDQLPGHGTVFSLYNIDKVPDIHDTLVEVYDSTVRIDHDIHIALLCKVDCILKMLNAANLFDARRKDFKTLLGMFSRWLAVVYGYNSMGVSRIRKAAGNLNNVAIIAVPEMTSLTPEMIATGLEELLLDRIDLSFATENTSKTDFLERTAQVMRSLESTSLCSHYNIDTLYWTSRGRQFHTVGHADFHGNVHTTSELFPNLKYGYSEKHFIVTTSEYSPYVIKSDVNGTVKFEGIYMDLLTELSKVLNFTYTLVEPPDGNWGGVDRIENGTPIFNGMIGQLQRHECDFAAAPLTIISVRDEVVDFTYPVSHEYSTVVVRKPDADAKKWKTLLNPFKPEVLVYIGVFLMVVTVVVFVVEKFGPYYCHPDHAQTRREQGGLHNLNDSFWYIYGALLCQGGVGLPDSLAGRTLVGFWWLVCIVIVGTYSGNLIAFLTVSKFEPPFNTLEEMVDLDGTYTWGTQGGTFWETVFTTSNVPVFRKVGDAMIKFNRSDQSIFNPHVDFHINKAKGGHYGWIGDQTSIELAMSTECNLFTIKERFLPTKDAFAFQHNSPHTAIFSEQIMKNLEAGLLGMWRRKWWPKMSFCPDGNRPTAQAITLLDVQSASYVCLIGILMGSVAFVVEICVFRWQRKKLARKEMKSNSAETAEVE